MQTLEVTDEQYAIVQQLRDEIGEHVVGKYGCVRERDAVQFLIDNLHDELELEPGASGDEDAVSDGVDTEADLQTVSYDEDDSVETPDEPAVDPDPVAGSEPSSDLGFEDRPEPASDGSESDGSDDETVTGGDADDDEMLDEMMNLLRTHDDKWEEASSGDARYAVTLPDGSVETVQTKDDVRALLFKNYR